MDGFTLITLLSLAFLTGFLTHWFLTRKQRWLLREYRRYKKALASVDQAILTPHSGRTKRRKNGQ
jgi:hypothetical protein